MVSACKRVLADRQGVLGSDHLYYSAGRVGDAEALLRDALARCQWVVHPADPRGK